MFNFIYEMELTETDVKKKLDDILIELSWAQISEQYFGKYRTWLYHKMNGSKKNGEKVDCFSSEEVERLKGALCDLARRIDRCANSL